MKHISREPIVYFWTLHQQIITLSQCWWSKCGPRKKMFVSGMVFNIWDTLIPDKRVNPASPAHIPHTFNRRGNVAADLQTVFVVFCAVLPSWCQADSSMSCVFYVHGYLEKYPAFFAMQQWSSHVYKLWMYKRTMAPCGPDLGASNRPCVPMSSIFAVLFGFKCFWRPQFARSLSIRLAK